MRVETVYGPEIEPWLPALAALRITVFRSWPYLYDGDLDYESRYLATYCQSAESIFVLAREPDDDAIVGCSTGIPLADETANVQAPFVSADISPERVFYFGESVLLPKYRGLGLGHRFFDAREEHAIRLGRFALTAFCAVDRDPTDSRRPADARDLTPFWSSRGYRQQPAMQATMEWPEVGAEKASSHRLTFWMKALSTADEARVQA